MGQFQTGKVYTVDCWMRLGIAPRQTIAERHAIHKEGMVVLGGGGERKTQSIESGYILTRTNCYNVFAAVVAEEMDEIISIIWRSA